MMAGERGDWEDDLQRAAGQAGGRAGHTEESHRADEAESAGGQDLVQESFISLLFSG
jgi:hypothetical protein